MSLQNECRTFHTVSQIHTTELDILFTSFVVHFYAVSVQEIILYCSKQAFILQRQSIHRFWQGSKIFFKSYFCFLGSSWSCSTTIHT